jgi:hypothetical protein
MKFQNGLMKIYSTKVEGEDATVTANRERRLKAAGKNLQMSNSQRNAHLVAIPGITDSQRLEAANQLQVKPPQP